MALHATAASEASIGDDSTTCERRGKIRQWISDIDSIDNVALRSSIAGTELNSSTSSEDPRTGGYIDGTTYKGSESTLSKLEPDHLLPEDDLDGEDDFFVEAAQQALETGSASFGSGDYEDAAAYLREALTMIKGLTIKQQALCDTWELRRMLGVCAFHVYGPAEAEAALLSVLDNAPKNAILSEQQRLQISEIAHFLSQTYVKMGDLNKAYRYCEYALRGRRRVLGKNHEDSYESLALMARVLDLQSNQLRAQFFTDMIPASERETYVPRFQNLKPSETTAIAADEPANRAATSLGESLDNALQDVSSEKLSTPKSRPVSAISGPVSALASNSSDAVSPPGSPEFVRTDRHSHGRDRSSTYERPRSRSQNQNQLLPVAPYQQGFARPSHSRSVSDLPIPEIPEVNVLPPSSTQLYVPERRLTTDRSIQSSQSSLVPRRNVEQPEQIVALPSHEAWSAPQQGPVVFPGPAAGQNDGIDPAAPLYPQPLKLQRPTYASELPGDTHFSIALGAPPTAPLPSPPTKKQHFEAIEARSSPPALPPQYQPYLPPPEPHPINRQTIRPPSEPRPVDQQSTSSEHRASTSSQYSRSTANFATHEIQPDIVMIRRNTDRDHQQPRKTSLMKMFRSKSSATEVQTPTKTTPSGGIRLSRLDLDIIKHECITDTIIDFWQEHLEQTLIKGNTKYVLMRPVRCYFLINESEITPSLKATLPDFRTTVHVLIPLKSSSGHWSLLLVSAQDAMACHYDPYTGKNRMLAEKVTRRIEKFLGEDNSKLTFLEVEEIPEQSEAKDSGVFVCFFMQYLVEKLMRTHVSQKTDASLECKAIRGKDGRKEILKVVKAMGGIKE